MPVRKIDALTTGDIVWAFRIPDPRGCNIKHRAAVVLQRTINPSTSEPFLRAIAISKRVPDPPDGYVFLEYDHTGRCRTGLKQKCAAVCIESGSGIPWLVKIDDSNFDRKCGEASTDELRQIIACLKSIQKK